MVNDKKRTKFAMINPFFYIQWFDYGSMRVASLGMLAFSIIVVLSQ